MSGSTRRHPGRPKAPPALCLVKVEHGTYKTEDGAVRIENANGGKREACWNAYIGDTYTPIETGFATLTAARRKMARLQADGITWTLAAKLRLARKMAAS